MGSRKKIAVIDVGGTNIKYGIFENGEITEYHETATNARLGGAHVMEKILEILSGFSDFEAVGISTAGQVDAQNGSILYANENIPGYTGMEIKKRVEERFAVPVAVENDVNCAAYGEACFGAGKEEKDFLCLTYGTGVGGAILMNHKVYHGAGGIAGEFGGILIHPEERSVPGDFYSGCYEKYASTTALVRAVQEQYPKITNGREIFARLEEPGIEVLVGQWMDEIVYGLDTLIHIFNPGLIVLGGGIMEQSYIRKGVRDRVEKTVIPGFAATRIVQAELGNKAGLLGAASYAMKAERL